MEAGFDYLLLRSRLHRKLFKYVGILSFGFGVLLLASGGAYYGYAAKARADLGDLNVTVLDAGPSQSLMPPTGSRISGGLSAIGDGGPGYFAAVDDKSGLIAPTGPSKDLPEPSDLAIDAQNLYPWAPISSSAESELWPYEPLARRQLMMLREFTPLDSGEAPPSGALDSATRIIVPSLDIDSAIKELELLELGESRAYETPDRVVGHIPETVNPGEAGSSWLFGHTESPTLGEGSVFFNLSQIPSKLRDGEDVYIITENGRDQYLYRVTSSRVVHQNDLRLYETDQATIHLVSCVPRWVYDHRLIISGELVGQKTKS